MAMHQGLDLSRFKKVSSDKKTTTLKHSAGHELKIAHSSLTPKLREALDKLPMAEGGDVKKKDDDAPAAVGAPAPADFVGPPSDDAAPPQVGAPAPTDPPGMPSAPADAQIGAPPPSPDQGQAAAPSNGQALDPSSPATAAPDAAPAPNPYAAMASQPSGDASGGNGPAQPQAAAAPSTPALPPIQAPAEVAADLKTQDALNQQDLTLGHIKPETYQSLFAKKDTLGKIGTIFGMLMSGAGSGLAHQPNALLEMMNKQIGNDLDAQKSSATNAQNLLQLNQQHEFQKAQARRMEFENANTAAQATRVPHENALSDAQTQEVKMKAQAAARMQANRFALHSLVQNLSKMTPGTPEYARAEQALGMMSQGVQNENYDIADRAASAMALSRAINGTPEGGATNPEGDFQNNQSYLRVSGHPDLAKDNEEKHMPGISGKASVPLTAEDRNTIQSSQALQGSLQRLRDFSVKNANSLNPSVINQGRALAAQVQGDFRQATHGGVYKEGEQHFIGSVIPDDPTKFVPNVRVLPKLDAVLNETKARGNQFLKQKGFQTQGQAPAGDAQGRDAMAIAWAKSNPKDPRSAKILKAAGAQ